MEFSRKTFAMEKPVLTWRVGSNNYPISWKSVEHVLEQTWRNVDEVRVGVWVSEMKAFNWRTLDDLLQASKATPSTSAPAPSPSLVPVPAETLKRVLDDCNQNTAELEARIKKLQEQMGTLIFTSAGYAKDVVTLRDRVAQLEEELALMEEAAANRGAKDLNTDSKVDAMSKSLTYWTRRFVEFEDQLVALRNPALGDKTEEPPTKCQPGCTKKGIHKFCSEPPATGSAGKTPEAELPPPTPAGNPGEPEVKCGWKIEKRDCEKHCAFASKHTHWARRIVGSISFPMPCQPGCVYKGPHTGISCVVLE